ncbi:helix-turn-helix domain-containing protein [uncultured Tateyamaria sp.]|uniref:helix-turn-helix domain-containing protein n=1 Tax=uncultured Tateyamaria sp. TaxID=455651 RepID=UPI002617CFD3|nr:helix-turn-helix domain-containing protein [uncultured Tateyamaria sp.]
MAPYQYTECGLDNVFIEGMNVVEDHAGEETVTIPAIGLLHQVIAEGIVSLPSKMSGKELRFLRTEMGMTQEQLAEILKVTPLTVSRWEREESPIKDAAEMLIRIMAVQRLELDVDMDVDDVSEKVTLSVRSSPIRIDGSDPQHYNLVAA